MIVLRAVFRWNNRRRLPENAERAQAYLDNAVLKDTDKYFPMRTGVLKRSDIPGTGIGSGLIEYIAPYAKRLYYGVNIRFSRSRHPLAQAKRFERELNLYFRDMVDEVFGEGTCRKCYGDILPSLEMHIQLFDALKPYFEEEAQRRRQKMNRYNAGRTGNA